MTVSELSISPQISSEQIQLLLNTFQSSGLKTLELKQNADTGLYSVLLIDQTILPETLKTVEITSVKAMTDAITTMIVRGAPAIGIAGAYGLLLSAQEAFTQNLTLSEMKAKLAVDAGTLYQTRPTAVNLEWALAELKKIITGYDNESDTQGLLDQLCEQASAIHQNDLERCIRIGEYGKTIIPSGAGVLTHCNAGGLATAGYGTALGVIRSAYADDKTINVYADETRPRLQGAKLTTWELHHDNIPVTLISDGMSGLLMKQGKIQAVVTGADRIAANGDSANKIGTYNLAIVAKAHGIPFYIAAPLSTIDMAMATGDEIPIEERSDDEIALIGETRICPEGIQFYNPAFDVTPADYITAIITDKGIVYPDYVSGLKILFD